MALTAGLRARARIRFLAERGRKFNTPHTTIKAAV
jgi:hypothetical protein